MAGSPVNPFDHGLLRFQWLRASICVVLGHRLQRIAEQITPDAYFTESKCLRCGMVQVLQSCDPLDLR